MNPQTEEQQIDDLQGRVRELELEIGRLAAQARVVRFVGSAVVVSVIGLLTKGVVEIAF